MSLNQGIHYRFSSSAVTLCEQLRKEFANPNQNDKTIKTLKELKLLLANLGLLLPNTKDQKELLLVRETIEMGALLAVRTHDVNAFERYIAQLFTFYRDYKNAIPESPRMYMLLGLNLLRLLSQTRLSEFHTLLETIGSTNLKNLYIQHPVQIEQALMEGSYNKVWNSKINVPAPEYSFFMDTLMGTIRNEIASCSERAYEYLPLADASTLLYLENQDQMLSFCQQRGWNVDLKTSRINFVSGDATGHFIPTHDVIHNVLSYAQELERIV
ncbi:COP9 signalosome [Globomyces pollinis-pini]|nr:COP9 signalosome [Globomyces pollinis-pini]